ncbi:MAG: hypothetical protein BHW48_01255 [Roseburia sp. CAG:10041_57]|nr:MAG: hypothetical protein BHW48_01255 [Roseburia sp. CAG:10041_57]
MLAISACMLTGCIDSMPDMTEEQSELVAEYAADMLLKYSPNYHYRIADEEEVASAEAEMETSQEEETTQEESQPSQDLSQTGSGETVSVGAETSVEDGSEYDLAAFFGMNQFSIMYASCEITDAYPNAESGVGFSVTAPQGYNLLVLHFDVENLGEEAAQCDLFDQISKVTVNVNDAGYVQALGTLLTNDLTTYMEDIPAGEVADAVVVVPVEQTDLDEIQTAVMQITTQDSVVNINLE